MKSLIGIVVGVLGLATSAAAQVPVAIVEDVQGKVVGVEFMDYVAPGKVIKLGPKASVVLGYIKSCWRETITGGTVVVGEEQSMVHLSEIQRAFEIGFLVALPFLIIDLVVSAVLMSMGMMMVPPAAVSLPFKLAFFVVADGWSLVSGALVRSYF